MADMMTQQSMAYLRAIAKGDPLPNAESDETEAEEGDEPVEIEAILEADTATEETPEEEAELVDETETEITEEVPAPKEEETSKENEPTSDEEAE